MESILYVVIAREAKCDESRLAAVVTAEGMLCWYSAEPVSAVPGIAGLLWICEGSWKHKDKEAVTGIQCNSIVCKATCPAALQQKEGNRIAFATAEWMMDLSG